MSDGLTYAQTDHGLPVLELRSQLKTFKTFLNLFQISTEFYTTPTLNSNWNAELLIYVNIWKGFKSKWKYFSPVFFCSIFIHFKIDWWGSESSQFRETQFKANINGISKNKFKNLHDKSFSVCSWIKKRGFFLHYKSSFFIIIKIIVWNIPQNNSKWDWSKIQLNQTASYLP